MTGGIGNPLILNTYNDKNVNPGNNISPNGAGGRIVLTVPAVTSSAVENAIYSGWLYAAVTTSAGTFDGLFVTKDFGQNWTQVGLTTLPQLSGSLYQPSIPTNDITQEEYPIDIQNQGSLYLTLTIDPTNPNIVYLGGFGGDDYPSGTGLVRARHHQHLGRPRPDSRLQLRGGRRHRRFELATGHGQPVADQQCPR